MLETFFDWLITTIGDLGYTGIFLLMTVESSFIPFPSELVVPPAGYLIAQGQMSWTGVLLAGALGSLFGALINYALALYVGRGLVERYGRYLGFSARHFDKSVVFFNRHGSISTFVGRLIVGVRQYISFPAGLARMDLKRFCFYTTLGASIWVWVLAYLGYLVGNNRELVMTLSREWSLYALGACVALVAVYVLWHRRQAATAVASEGLEG
jgi:membrane protein DedA with SNARE-associated domain